MQLDLFMNEQRREKQEKLDRAVDDIRRRFGYHSVQRAFMYQDKILSSLDAQDPTPFIQLDISMGGKCFE